MVRLHDIMTVDPVAISPDATIREAAELLASEHVSGLPVVSGTEIVGVLSVSDIVQFDADRPGRTGRPAGDEQRWSPGEDVWPADGEDEVPAAYYTDLREDAATDLYGRFGQLGEGDADELAGHRVEDLMTRELLALPPETEVREAARRMLRADVHRVLVVEEGRLLGVVSTTDMMKAVAQYGIAG